MHRDWTATRTLYEAPVSATGWLFVRDAMGFSLSHEPTIADLPLALRNHGSPLRHEAHLHLSEKRPAPSCGKSRGARVRGGDSRTCRTFAVRVSARNPVRTQLRPRHPTNGRCCYRSPPANSISSRWKEKLISSFSGLEAVSAEAVFPPLLSLTNTVTDAATQVASSARKAQKKMRLTNAGYAPLNNPIVRRAIAVFFGYRLIRFAFPAGIPGIQSHASSLNRFKFWP